MRERLRWLRAYLTPADLVLLAALLLSGFLSIPIIGSQFSGASEALVTIDGKPVYTLRFAHDGRVVIDAPLGPVEIEVKNGRIRVVRSSCPDQFCVAQRPVTPFGGVIVCAPNRLVIQAKRKRVSDLDCVTQ